jgi:hypothetical protein
MPCVEGMKEINLILRPLSKLGRFMKASVEFALEAIENTSKTIVAMNPLPARRQAVARGGAFVHLRQGVRSCCGRVEGGDGGDVQGCQEALQEAGSQEARTRADAAASSHLEVVDAIHYGPLTSAPLAENQRGALLQILSPTRGATEQPVASLLFLPGSRQKEDTRGQL